MPHLNIVASEVSSQVEADPDEFSRRLKISAHSASRSQLAPSHDLGSFPVRRPSTPHLLTTILTLPPPPTSPLTTPVYDVYMQTARLCNVCQSQFGLP